MEDIIKQNMNKETGTNSLEREIAQVLNIHCQENFSDTPDFILAQYLLRCLDNFNKTITRREYWYGRKLIKDTENILED